MMDQITGLENIQDMEKNQQGWKMQDLENDGPITGLKNTGHGNGQTKSHAGKYRTWKMTDQIAGLENV